MTVAEFFDDLRKAYLGDARGKRFKDAAILRVYFFDTLNALWVKDKSAFYSIAANRMPDALQAMPFEDVLRLSLAEIIAPSRWAVLRAKMWEKTSASQQRGQTRGAPLAGQQRQEDTPE